ncbi:MAG: hypothetical protein AAFN70_21380, partial [Planctomycetota bacterium]
MWRILLFLVIVACGLFFYGTRQVWISLGASSEAQLVDISDIQPGQAVEDRHVNLVNFQALAEHAFTDGKQLYIPLAPADSKVIPRTRDTRIWLQCTESGLASMDEYKGLITGTCGDVLEYEALKA